MGFQVNLKDDSLPNDKRMRPWPSIRKFKMSNIKSVGDYLVARLEVAKKHIKEHAAFAFSERAF